MRQISLDTETTGLDPASGHRIIEIGCVELINRTLTGKVFHYYVNPEREIDRGASAVHGIYGDFLLDKPLFKDIVDELINFVQDAELIIHNAPFDVGFLNHEFNLTKKSALKPIEQYCKIFDTLPLARQMHPGQKNNLDALCKRYSVDNSGRDFHGALLDARILAHVYLAMTGGQGTMFDEVAVPMQAARAVAGADFIDDLQVVVASDGELQEHREYLEMLRKASKEVVEWG